LGLFKALDEWSKAYVEGRVARDTRKQRRLMERQHAAQEKAARAAITHQQHAELVPEFLRQSPWITAATPHAEAWPWYVQWNHGQPPLNERDFATERRRYQ
jgi:hypothetical protein